jgi:hypothetical protein
MDNTIDQMVPTAGQVWKRMPEEKRRQAAEAFWREKEGVEQQFEAMTLLARQHKFRPVFVQRMPIDKRTRYLAAYKAMPDALAARLLVSYHLAHQRPMLGALLDALGIAHEEGLITADPDAPLDADRLRAAVASLEASFPSDDVTLYLLTLLSQDPETWKGLASLPQVSLAITE